LTAEIKKVPEERSTSSSEEIIPKNKSHEGQAGRGRGNAMHVKSISSRLFVDALSALFPRLSNRESNSSLLKIHPLSLA